MDSTVCILVLCGLPAAGKTTFVKHLFSCLSTIWPPLRSDIAETSFQKDTTSTAKSRADPDTPALNLHSSKLKHVCFDSIIPSDIYDKNQSSYSENDSSWKLHRKSILQCVDRDIQSVLKKRNIPLSEGLSEDVSHINHHVATSYKMASWVDADTEPDPDHSLFVFVIDDNMFYPSMRQEYYQLAQNYNTGFAQVYLHCSMEDAICRNKGRKDSVSEETIIKMAAKLKPPDHSANWERHSITIDAGSACRKENLISTLKLVVAAAADPMTSAPEIDQEAIEADRIICSQNTIHQADQIIRKLIGQQMGQFKGGKDERQQQAKLLNDSRKQLLEDFRAGIVAIPHELQTDMTDAAKDQSSPLFAYMEQTFKDRLKLKDTS